jgi:PEP-CTERM motif
MEAVVATACIHRDINVGLPALSYNGNIRLLTFDTVILNCESRTNRGMKKHRKHLVEIVRFATAMALTMPAFAGSIFTPGNLVVSVEGNGSGTGSYTDNQAAPLTLYQFDPVSGTTGPATFVNSLMLPQTASGANLPVSGEYGSSSEGTLQLSGNGQYLTIMGYGINANQFNSSPGTYSILSTNTALGQSGSQTGQSYTPVPRVVALIDANGNVDSSTGIYNIFNGNNPRSAYTADGTNIYVSGQGNNPDNTGGVFYTTRGSNSATSITGADAGSGDSQDTREVQIYNNTLYVSTDSKEGSTNRSYVGTLGAIGTPPTTVANGGNGPTQLTGTGTSTGKYTITATNGNGINSAGDQINLSPENYFFANSNTLYIADSGSGKQTSATSTLGDGGLQKWSLVAGSWVLDYTIAGGLNLVQNAASNPNNTSGTTGLYGLTGELIDGGTEVELFATNFTIGDLDPTYLYGVTDVLADSTNPGESFTQLAAAPADSNFKGVSFAPTATPEPSTFVLLGAGMAALAMARRRKALG